MARKPAGVSPPVFNAPMRLDWTDEKLRALSQEQLLNLLDNLDRQRSIGRVATVAADAVDQRIMGLLTSRNSARRRKQLREVRSGVGGEPQ